jgi:hypothetical protein
LFNIDPDPLTGKRRQSNGSGYKTETRGVEGLPGRDGRVREGRRRRFLSPKVAEALDEWLTGSSTRIKPSMTQNWRNYAAYYVIPASGSVRSK